MKLQYKIGSIAAALAIMTSCSMHDPYDDILQAGQSLPTVSWELGSTVVTAGDEVSFKGKYYTDENHTPHHSEVWALVSQSESAAATLKLTPTYAYTQTVTSADTIRMSQEIARYPHSMATWNGHEFEVNVTFPTSQTLRTLNWGNVAAWDADAEDRFNSYYPETFKKDFVDEVINTLTQDSTYYNDLRYLYVNYDFTLDQISNVISNYASLNSGGELDQLLLTVSDEKSDIWYTSTENVVGKYYIKNVDGVSVYEEVPVDYVAPEGVQIFDVYESSPWLFCRYDDNVGGTVTTVRSNYMPVFRDLISLIPFQDWIYDSVEGVYTASFTRSYSLGVTFKVVDTDGNVGYTTDDMTVTLN